MEGKISQGAGKDDTGRKSLTWLNKNDLKEENRCGSCSQADLILLVFHLLNNASH